MSRSSARAARRADRDGSGPTLDESVRPRFPGASSAFALFGEVLITGLLVTAVSLPIVTLPVGLAAGARHLRRFVRAEASPLSAFWADVRAGLVGGAVVGLAATVLAAVLLVDVALGSSGVLPGGTAVVVIGWAGLALVAAAMLVAAGCWTPEGGWRRAGRDALLRARADPLGVGYLVATAVFIVVATWALVPLVVPALGCAALAVIAVGERPRRHSR